MMLFSLSTGAMIGIIIGCVAAVLVIILIACIIGMYNSLIRLGISVDEAWATIDVYLKKRYDLIPNLVETVKGYAKHESQTLEKVIAARGIAMGASGPEQKIAAENQLSGCLKTLFALTESYPTLKADMQFMGLQRQLDSVETDLAQARKYYNGVCRRYNTKIRVFPSNLVAGMMHLSPRKYFEVATEEERQNVKVRF